MKSYHLLNTAVCNSDDLSVARGPIYTGTLRTSILSSNIYWFFFYFFLNQILERSHLSAFNRISLTSCKGQSNNLAVSQTMCIIRWDSVNFICCHKNILLLQKIKPRRKYLPDDCIQKFKYPNVFWNIYLSNVNTVRPYLYILFL